MELHEPYFKNPKKNIPPYENNFNKSSNKNSNKNFLKKAYLKDARYLANKTKLLLDFLKKSNSLEDTLIIVLSDHGQLLGEYDKYGHGTFLYDELLRVPLWIKYPKGFEIIRNQERERWSSTVNIKKFILNAIRNKVFDERLLFFDFALSETYGVHARIDHSKIKNREEYEKYDRYRIAIYYKDFKGIFNVEAWKFEKIVSYGDTEPDKEIERKMLKEIINFLNLSIPKFKM